MQTQLAPQFIDTPEGIEAARILGKCVHCGFCTATCPTYQLLGDELDGPRGRIYLIKQMAEGQTPTEKTRLHLDRCLTCRNCESTCPSGVQYGKLIDIGRQWAEENTPERPLGQRLTRWALKEGLTKPALFNSAMALGRLVRPLMPSGLKRKIPEHKTKVHAPSTNPSKKTAPIRKFAKEDFQNAVLRTKEYILAGDCMQVVIGQRISKPFTDSPLSLYRALRSLNPSPYMYFYDFGDLQIVGSSPEILVRQEKRAAEKIVTIRPLAGTRPRGANPEEDERLAKELLADPKEIAEHVMLIDLARNDVGRIAKTGSVKVTDSMSIEKYSHVQHIVSSVEGDLLDNMSNMDVLRATFPAGTLSGAPKIRAMEIIDEMEIVKRGVYGGAAGYLSFSGDMDVAIVIRTGIIKDGMVHAQAGAGVVADSDPESEWKETEAKARAVLRAAEMVQGGLDASHD